MSLLNALRDFCCQQGMEKTYWIAYSGGLDSHVLLSLSHALREECALSLRAIHVNHGLSSNAKVWAAHCAQVCKEYEIDYVERSVTIALQAGDSLEEAARVARYAVFADCLGENDILLTAHHQDDQAETLLLQLLRGAGLKGLAAMPAIKSFAHGLHARPLLTFPRTTLEYYAQEQQLRWVEDESNHNHQLTRNFIRHDILALLKTRWPSVASTLSRSALHCSEAEDLLQEFGLEIMDGVKGSRPETLSVSKLLQVHPKKQRLILRTWIHHLGYSLPDAKKLEAILSTVLTAGCDRMPCVNWRLAEVRRYRDDLYMMACLPSHDATLSVEWNLNQPTMQIGNSVLRASLVQGRGLRADIQHVQLRFRQGGEVAEMAGRGHHTLKNLFQEWDVPPWERDRIPLVYVKEKLIAVLGYFLEQDYAAKEDEMGWDLKA